MNLSLRIFAALGFVMISGPSWSWDFQYHKAERAGELSACAASDDYADGWFTIRLFGEDMDFLVNHETLTLPFGTALGTVSFSIENQFFVLAAQTVSRDPTDLRSSSQTMYLTPKREDYETLFDALARGSELHIGLPNGDGYLIDLKGSARALKQASECWKQYPTGKFENNPFEKKKYNNPFYSPNEAPTTNPFRDL